MRVLISTNADALANVLADYTSTATVEAEYGDRVVEGTQITLAHHGPRSENPAPCVAPVQPANVEAIGVSHLDLDTLGGIAAILGRKPDANGFWNLAAFVDINGPHKLSASGATQKDLEKLHAFWAWSQDHRVFAPRDGSVADVTEETIAALDAIDHIVAGDHQLLEAGREWAAEKATLNADSFVESVEGVAVRVAAAFTNHLYNLPDGNVVEAIVAFNTATGAILLSFADTPQGCSAAELMRQVFGPDAGGHSGIAGSPRGERQDLDALKAVRDKAIEVLRTRRHAR